MTDSKMEDLCLLHSALKEKGEGEIKRIKEKYECIVRASDIKGRRGECRGLRGDGHAQAFLTEGIVQRMRIQASGMSSKPAAIW